MPACKQIRVAYVPVMLEARVQAYPKSFDLVKIQAKSLKI